MSEVVLIINFWGGIPSSLVKKALFSLPSLRSISLGGKCFTNAYVTNTNLNESFKDFISNKRMCGFPSKKNENMFHLFKRSGYTTAVFGCFGLENSLNPFPPRREYHKDARYSLNEYGIDIFSSQDGCFSHASSYSHDKNTILETNDFLDSYDLEKPLLLFLNLKGCNDCYHRRFEDPVSYMKQQIPGINKNKWYSNPDVNDARLVPSNVDKIKENCFHEVCEVSKKQNNKLYGESGDSNMDTRIKFLTLQNSGWKDLLQLDFLISRVLKNIREKFKKITSCALATNVISLEEYGVRYNAPIDSCTRSFWCIGKNDLDRPPEEISSPKHLLMFWDNFVDSHFKQQITSLCLVPTYDLDKKTLYNRGVVFTRGRYYSFTNVWSLRELMNIKSEDDEIHDVFEYNKQKTHWTLEKKQIHSIFNLTEDPEEVNNIINFCSIDFIMEIQSYITNTVIYMDLGEIDSNNDTNKEHYKNKLERVHKHKEIEKRQKEVERRQKEAEKRQKEIEAQKDLEKQKEIEKKKILERQKESEKIKQTQANKLYSKRVDNGSNGNINIDKKPLDTNTDRKPELYDDTEYSMPSIIKPSSIKKNDNVSYLSDAIPENTIKLLEKPDNSFENTFDKSVFKKKLSFDLTPKVYEFPKYKSENSVRRSTKVNVNSQSTLRRRESDLNQKHR